jgi:integrase
MPSYESRNGKIRAIVYVDHNRLTKTFDNKADARLWAISTENSVPETRFTPATFGHVLSEYQTLELEGRDNDKILVERLFQEKWVNMPFADLTIGHLSAYKRERLKTVKPSSFDRYWCMVRQAAYFAKYEWGWNVDPEMFRQIKVKIPPPSSVKRVSDDDIQTLIATANEYSRVQWIVPVIELAVATGMRRKEMAELTWGMVDFDRRYIDLTKTKTDYPRKIPLIKHIESILLKVFPETLDLTATVFGATVNGIKCAFDRIRRRAGLRINLHSLRHEAVSSLFERDLTPIEVASISGHRTLKSLMRYSHADTQNLLKKMEGNLS